MTAWPLQKVRKSIFVLFCRQSQSEVFLTWNGTKTKSRNYALVKLISWELILPSWDDCCHMQADKRFAFRFFFLKLLKPVDSEGTRLSGFCCVDLSRPQQQVEGAADVP